MFGNNNNKPNSNNKDGGIHHANIKDKDKAKQRLRSSFKRKEMIITLDKNDRKIRCTAVLTEIKPGSASVFVTEKLRKGSTLTLHLIEPLQMDVKARVRFCEAVDHMSPSSVKKAGAKRQYRMNLEFIIISQSERDAMFDYYQQVRDESYVATKWHHYVSEKAQAQIRAKAQEIKMKEAIKEAQDEPDLAKDDMIREEVTKTDVMIGGSKEADLNKQESDAIAAAINKEKSENEGNDEDAA